MRTQRRILGIVLLFAGACACAEDVSLPEATRVVLDNGAVLIVNEKTDVPLVGIEVLIRGGAVRDQEGKSGTASLFSGLVERGAGERSAVDIAESVESVGGDLAVAAELESIRISAEFLSRDLGLALEIIGDLVTVPTLDAGELEILKERQINLLRAAKDSDPGQLMPSYAARFLFGDHPYGNPLSGSENSLAGITVDAIRACFANEVGADRRIGCVSGGVDTVGVGGRVAARCGGWRGMRAPHRAPTSWAPPTTRRWS